MFPEQTEALDDPSKKKRSRLDRRFHNRTEKYRVFGPTENSVDSSFIEIATVSARSELSAAKKQMVNLKKFNILILNISIQISPRTDILLNSLYELSLINIYMYIISWQQL